MPKLRMLAFLIFVSTHVGLLAFGHLLPDSLAPPVVGTVYLPLWPLHAVGLPVFGRAESGGWSSPNMLGWLFVAGIWGVLWWMLASTIARLRKQ